MKNQSIRCVSSLFFTSLIAALTGCGSTPEPTISQGVYGLTVSYQKTTDSPGSAVPEVRLGIYDIDPATTEAEPKTSVSSDDDGFYEIALEVGDAWICVQSEEGLVQDKCKKFHVSQNVTNQINYAFGLENPWSNMSGDYSMSKSECAAAGGATYPDTGGGPSAECGEVIANVALEGTIEGGYCCR